MILQPVILSGGSGTRLWPMSREKYPKQLLSFIGGETMLQATASRLADYHSEDVTSAAPPIVVCNEEYRFLSAEQMRPTGGRILLEPAGRNTAPATTIAALLAVSGGEDALMLVMPADHLMLDPPAFHAAIDTAVTPAMSGAMVTFGIVPDRPETGYGYLADRDADQRHRWRRGCAAADGLRREAAGRSRAPVSRRRPASVEQRLVHDEGERVAEGGQALRAGDVRSVRQGLQGGFDRPGLRPGRSRSVHGLSVRLHRLCGDGEARRRGGAGHPRDRGPSHGGLVGRGRVGRGLGGIAQGCATATRPRATRCSRTRAGTLVITENRLVACLGLDDMIIVDTPDALLVARKDKTQDIKKIVSRLKAEVAAARGQPSQGPSAVGLPTTRSTTGRASRSSASWSSRARVCRCRCITTARSTGSSCPGTAQGDPGRRDHHAEREPVDVHPARHGAPVGESRASSIWR